MTPGIRYAAYPKSWNDSSERNAPTRPTKFSGAFVAPVVKNQTGSVGSWLTSEMSQISPTAKSATPRNSLRRRDNVDSFTSDLHQDGENQWAAARALLEKAPQLDAQLFGHQALIRPLLVAGGLDALGDHSGGVPKQRFGLTFVYDVAAGHEFRLANQSPAMTADPDDRNHQPVAGKVAPVAKHFVADFAEARHIDQDPSGRRLVPDSRSMAIELDDVAVLGKQNLQIAVAPRHDALCHPRVLCQLPVLAVDRDEVLGADERDDELQFLRRAVSRHVHVLHVGGDHVGAAAGDVAHRARDGLLVPGNRPRRQHDDVVRPELDEAMIVDGDARKRRLRFALRPRGHAEHVL